MHRFTHAAITCAPMQRARDQIPLHSDNTVPPDRSSNVSYCPGLVGSLIKAWERALKRSGRHLPLIAHRRTTGRVKRLQFSMAASRGHHIDTRRIQPFFVLTVHWPLSCAAAIRQRPHFNSPGKSPVNTRAIERELRFLCDYFVPITQTNRIYNENCKYKLKDETIQIYSHSDRSLISTTHTKPLVFRVWRHRTNLLFR